MEATPITSDLNNRRVRLEPEDDAALVKLAKDNDRSVAAELRRAVRFYLRANGGDGKRK